MIIYVNLFIEFHRWCSSLKNVRSRHVRWSHGRPSDATNDGPRGDPPAPESLKVQVRHKRCVSERGELTHHIEIGVFSAEPSIVWVDPYAYHGIPTCSRVPFASLSHGRSGRSRFGCRRRWKDLQSIPKWPWNVGDMIRLRGHPTFPENSWFSLEGGLPLLSRSMLVGMADDSPS